MSTKIVDCTCKNDFQDGRYGKDKRVANKTSKESGQAATYRCTVCLREHQVNVK